MVVGVLKPAMLAHAAALILAGAVPAHAQHAGHAAGMTGLYGPYPMSREASGTSWQPDAAPHEGLHLQRGDWTLMAHGFAWGVYDDQGGRRGDAKAFSASMGMLSARRPLGPGVLGLRAMASLDPAMGSHGYPLLAQTGESGDGRTPLIDRQHPHDLFMELAAAYSLPLGEEGSVFGYFGLPGEPALGPPVFMHRASAADNPEAPITHHWLDSTHIAYGAATLGLVWKSWKCEGSAFKGREPDERRWDVEAPKLDSFAARASFNPRPEWALQASYGRLRSPEALEAGEDVGRLTASVLWSPMGGWQAALAWGRNRPSHGSALDAFLLESARRWARGHAVFGRLERVDKGELFQPGDPKAGAVFTVTKLSLGGLYEFARRGPSRWGAGAVGSALFVPGSLEPAYGRTPLSFMLLLRVRLA